MRSWLLGWRLRYKRLAQIGVDIVLIWLALWLAFFVRLGLADVVNPFTDRTWLFIVAPLITIPIFVFSGMYRAVLRYAGLEALVAVRKDGKGSQRRASVSARSATTRQSMVRYRVVCEVDCFAALAKTR